MEGGGLLPNPPLPPNSLIDCFNTQREKKVQINDCPCCTLDARLPIKSAIITFYLDDRSKRLVEENLPFVLYLPKSLLRHGNFNKGDTTTGPLNLKCAYTHCISYTDPRVFGGQFLNNKYAHFQRFDD